MTRHLSLAVVCQTGGSTADFSGIASNDPGTNPSSIVPNQAAIQRGNERRFPAARVEGEFMSKQAPGTSTPPALDVELKRK